MASSSSTGPARQAPWVRGLQVLVLLAVGAFVVSTIPGVRSQPGFSTLLDGWLQGAAYVLCAALAVARPVSVQEGRLRWWLVAASLVLRALGFVLFLGYVRWLTPPPYPSVADAAWIAMALVLLAALGLRVREVAPRFSRVVFLDAVIGALTAAGLAVVLLFDTLVRLTAPGTDASAVTTNLTYPVLDVALLILVIGLLVAAEWRPRPADAVLCLGVTLFAVGDTVFLYQASGGTYGPGTWVAALSMLATAGIAFAAWTGPATPDVPVEGRPPALTVPALFALVCVAFLVYADFADVQVASIVLVTLALLVAIVRAILTLDLDRAVADRVIGATNEELLRFQALVETSTDFIAIAGTDGMVMYVNPAGRVLVGLDPDLDVTTTTIADYLTEEGQRASVEIEQPAVIAHGHWEGQSTLRNLRGGPPTPVEISSFLMLHPETGAPFALATVQRDISERLATEDALSRLAEQRRELLDRLVQAQEDERARIAADVHDDSVQAVAAVELRLGLLRRQLAEVDPDLVASVERAHETVTHATARLRHLLFDLESPALRVDLVTALGEAADYVFEDTGIRWSFVGDRSVDLPESARVTAYRVAKEAMVNARRHAGGRSVEIDVQREEGGVVVVVADDGRGVAEDALVARPGHLGLASMRDRAAIAGGSLDVRNVLGGGTEVRLWLPGPASVVGTPRREDAP